MSKNRYNLEWVKAYSTKDFEDKYTYNGDDLGCICSGDKVSFKLWSPYAEMVFVNIYESGDINNSDLKSSHEMMKTEKGVWYVSFDNDLEGCYYTFTVCMNGEENEFCDPYAKAVGVNGKRAMVIDLKKTNPEGWEDDKNPNEELPLCESVIYELHTRDFSADKSSDIENRGKFLGLIEEGRTVNGEGKIKSGIDHLKELGITHLHLLPFCDYATVDEAEEYNEKEYNWGYDPLNYNALEGSYSTNPFDGAVRINEFKKTVMGLHKNGISVVMDVVYNHVYNEEFCFNIAVPGYFHRIDSEGVLSDGSACGNDTASERSMVSKYIVDSVLYLAKEYHIDGFRFDLVGLIDVDTINKIREGLDKIRPNIMMYGEGWTLNTKLTKENIDLAVQKNVSKINNFAMFSDNLRDAIKGSVFEEEEKGFISGNTKGYDELIATIKGLPEWAVTPKQVVNYTSCHDNYTLFDKIHLCNKDIKFEDAVKQNILAFSIVMLSQGIPLMHAGEEMLRTKIDENGEYVSDSVRSSDFVNSIKWNDLNKKEYMEVFEFYKGIIAFRKAHKAFAMTDKKEIESKINFIETGSRNVIAYKVEEGNKNICIVFNSKNEEAEVEFGISNLDCFIDGIKAGTEILSKCNGLVKVEPVSCKVLIG